MRSLYSELSLSRKHLFLHSVKLFYDDQQEFLNLDVAALNKYWEGLLAEVDCGELDGLFGKNPDIFEKILKTYTYNSFGFEPFTKLVFFFLNKGFSISLRR